MKKPLKRKPLPPGMAEVVSAYQATGRVAHVYPLLGLIALNGFPRISYAEAFGHMRSVLRGDGDYHRKG